LECAGLTALWIFFAAWYLCVILCHAKTQRREVYAKTQSNNRKAKRRQAAALQNKKAKIESDAHAPIHLCLLIFLRPRLAAGLGYAG